MQNQRKIYLTSMEIKTKQQTQMSETVATELEITLP